MSVHTFDHAQVLPVGFHMPARMTAIALRDGVALISPIPIDDALAARIAALGEVRWLIAPNLLHHLYLGAAAQRYPQAQVLAPAGLQRKTTLSFQALEPATFPLRTALTVLPIEGAPGVGEHAFYEPDSRTLVVTDLVFNVLAPRGWVAHTVLSVVGCHGKLAMSRVWRSFSKDREATARSVQRLLALPFETLVMAHGEIVREDARARLHQATRWLSPSPLPT